MRKIEGLGLVMPAVVAGLLVLAVGAGVALSVRSTAPLPALVAIPHATLASPRQGPAIYKGRLFSAKPRSTPMGRPAAAYWWWGVYQPATNRWRTICYANARDHLLLEADGRRVPVTLFDSRREIALVSDERQDYPDRFTADLGPLPVFVQYKAPASLTSCKRHSLDQYRERLIPEGTVLEVLACYSKGELGPCPPPVPVVLSVHTMWVNFARRVSAAHKPMRVATALGAIPLLVLGISAGFMRKRRHSRESLPEDEA